MKLLFWCAVDVQPWNQTCYWGLWLVSFWLFFISDLLFPGTSSTVVRLIFFVVQLRSQARPVETISAMIHGASCSDVPLVRMLPDSWTPFFLEKKEISWCLCKGFAHFFLKVTQMNSKLLQCFFSQNCLDVLFSKFRFALFWEQKLRDNFFLGTVENTTSESRILTWILALDVNHASISVSYCR